jgi:hypothetical protein
MSRRLSTRWYRSLRLSYEELCADYGHAIAGVQASLVCRER